MARRHRPRRRQQLRAAPGAKQRVARLAGSTAGAHPAAAAPATAGWVPGAAPEVSADVDEWADVLGPTESDEYADADDFAGSGSGSGSGAGNFADVGGRVDASGRPFVAESDDGLAVANQYAAADFADAGDFADDDNSAAADVADDDDGAEADVAEADVADGDFAASDEPAWRAGLATAGPWGALAERWVPEPLRGARMSPGRRGAALLAAIAAVAAIVAAVGVWRSRPAAVPVAAATASWVTVGEGADPTPAVAAGAGTAARDGSDSGVAGSPAGGAGDDGANRADDSAASADPPGPILVSVTGRVRNPGVVSVPAEARVADAIAAAGGVTDTDLLAGMNLAARLHDGASVVIAGPTGNSVDVETSGDAPADATPTATTVSINSADAAALEQLPGVGPVTAAAILAYRADHGPFTDLAQLQEVSGIGPATYARLAPRVRL